jgi:hypothetical protein
MKTNARPDFRLIRVTSLKETVHSERMTSSVPDKNEACKPKGLAEAKALPTHLATERHVSACFQKQAPSAILFVSQHVLEAELDWIDGVEAFWNGGGG